MENEGSGVRAAVHSTDHFALNVPSTSGARRLFTAFGLDVREVGPRDNTELELRALDGHLWARILPASRKSLVYLASNCFPGDLNKIERQVRDAGGRRDVDVPVLTDRRHHAGDGVRFENSGGNLTHVNVGPKTTPSEKKPFGRVYIRPDCRGFHPALAVSNSASATHDPCAALYAGYPACA